MSEGQPIPADQAASDQPPTDDMQGLHIEVGAGESGPEIVQKLQLRLQEGQYYPQAVIILVGTTNQPVGADLIPAHLVQLFGRGLARAASDKNALIIDASSGGEAARALSSALQNRSNRARLIKVSEEEQIAPVGGNGTGATTEAVAGAESVSAGNQASTDGTGTGAMGATDIGYSRYISIKSGGSIADTVNKLASELVSKIPVEPVSGAPALTLLVNEGVGAREVVAYSVRQGWAVMIVQGSKGLADQLDAQWKEKLQYWQDLAARKPGTDPASVPKFFVADALVAEILTSGNLHFFALTNTPEKLKLAIDRCFNENALLNQIQRQQHMYSQKANEQQKRFERLQGFILRLGVFITALAAFLTFYKQMRWSVPFNVPFVGVVTLEGVMNYILIALPVLLAVLIAGSNRFNPGNKWVTLRAASQALKRERYRYQTRTGVYSPLQTARNASTREAVLAKMAEAITGQWIEGNVDYSLFPPPPPSAEKAASNEKTSLLVRLSKFAEKMRRKGTQPTSGNAPENLPAYLSPDDYITGRLQNQIDYYKDKCRELGKQLQQLQWLILGLGGVATLLAAWHMEWVITITTAIATACANYLEYNQVSNSLKQYNHAILNLTNVYNWWKALGDEQADPLNVDKLVDYTETILQSEQAGWIQQMQAALTDLRAQQAGQGTNASTTEPINYPRSNQSAGENGSKNSSGGDQPENPPPVSPTEGDG